MSRRQIIQAVPLNDRTPAAVADALGARARRVMLLGAPGVGKSTLATALAREIVAAGQQAWCLGADPGSPSFGVPGAVCFGEWRGDAWHLVDLEALCSLDAGRFRLPLLAAVERLAKRHAPRGVLLLDAPGVVRGVAGAELTESLIEVLAIDTAIVLQREAGAVRLDHELAVAGCEVIRVPASPAARRAGKRERARRRTRMWERYLTGAHAVRVRLDDVRWVGTPPPHDVESAWEGRQIGVLAAQRTLAMGEIAGWRAGLLELRLPPGVDRVSALLLRDARRDAQGLLNTAPPFAGAAVRYVAAPDVAPYPRSADASAPGTPLVRVGAVVATLVNGVFGDPLLHVRLRHQRRSLLFDLGDGARLPARVAHQVSDVFVSHAHLDHIGGFLWLLRSRIGRFPACRLYGPPGLADHVAGLLQGVEWDRVGDNAPRFEIAELHDDRLIRFTITAGDRSPSQAAGRDSHGGVLLDEPSFRVRAVTLDHGTPVLAFALEQPTLLNVRKERLAQEGLAPGPWLTALKRGIASGDDEGRVTLPDGRSGSVAALAEALIIARPGPKLAYATDLADTARNRERLVDLAGGAHTLFCEATFVEADAAQARRTGHLTARACGEIATAAAVTHLVPFHLSRRYEHEHERVYDEVRAVCSRVVVPR